MDTACRSARTPGSWLGRSFAAVAVLAAIGCSGSAPRPAPLSDSAKRVRDGLEALSDGAGNWSKFSAVYDDQDAARGGLKLAISGNGKVVQEASREEVGEPRDLTLADLKVLVDVLREHQAWEQRVPERDASPDELQARLTITYGADSVTIWEWYNERDRLAKILKFMTSVAWKAPPR